MRSRDSVLRLARFKLQERTRQAQGIEAMIGEFLRKQEELEALIRAEEQRSGISDPEHFNYPTTAKSALSRRDNLLASVAELNDQLDMVRNKLAEEEAEFARLEQLAKPEIPRITTVGPASLQGGR